MKKVLEKWDIVVAKCPECNKIKKLSFDKGKTTRYTWCWTCRLAVIWEKVEDK